MRTFLLSIGLAVVLIPAAAAELHPNRAGEVDYHLAIVERNLDRAMRGPSADGVNWGLRRLDINAEQILKGEYPYTDGVKCFPPEYFRCAKLKTKTPEKAQAKLACYRSVVRQWRAQEERRLARVEGRKAVAREEAVQANRGGYGKVRWRTNVRAVLEQYPRLKQGEGEAGDTWWHDFANIGGISLKRRMHFVDDKLFTVFLFQESGSNIAFSAVEADYAKLRSLLIRKYGEQKITSSHGNHADTTDKVRSVVWDVDDTRITLHLGETQSFGHVSTSLVLIYEDIQLAEIARKNDEKKAIADDL